MPGSTKVPIEEGTLNEIGRTSFFKIPVSKCRRKKTPIDRKTFCIRMKTLAFHAANPGLKTGTTYGPLRTTVGHAGA